MNDKQDLFKEKYWKEFLEEEKDFCILKDLINEDEKQYNKLWKKIITIFDNIEELEVNKEILIKILEELKKEICSNEKAILLADKIFLILAIYSKTVIRWDNSYQYFNLNDFFNQKKCSIERIQQLYDINNI